MRGSLSPNDGFQIALVGLPTTYH